MKNEYVYFSKFEVTGVVNPILVIRGNFLKKNIKLEIKLDDNIIIYNNEEIIINEILNKSCKQIKCYVLIDNKKVFLLKKKTSKLSRLFKKVKSQIINYKIKIHKNYRICNPFIKKEYNYWLKKQFKEKIENDFNYNPLISIITPVYNVKKEFLIKCVRSVKEQIYKNWELILIDDCSTNKETINTLENITHIDKRIKVHFRKENGHISRASNDGIKSAKGEFIALLDNDDVLTKDALYQVVKILNTNQNLDLIYSDEDKLDLNEIPCEPHFKSDFAPDTLLSQNYICHFTVIRKKLIDEVKGFAIGLEGAQDHDLFLKITEKTSSIYHIPKILYHWRMSETSTAMNKDNKGYANEKGKLAVEKALKRRKINGKVEINELTNFFKVNYFIKNEPKISIIISLEKNTKNINKFLKSIYETTKYNNLEIVLIELYKEKNQDLTKFAVKNNIKITKAINTSKINEIIKQLDSKYIVFLKQNVYALTPAWLEIMVGYASQKHIGIVGTKILNEDKSILSAGVILGGKKGFNTVYQGAPYEDLGMYGRLKVPFNYSVVSLECLMISKKKFEEVNGLNKNLSLKYALIDLNLKILSNNYFNVTVPQVELIYQLENKEDFFQQNIKDIAFIQKKWNKILKNDPFYNPNFSKKIPFMLEVNYKGRK